MSDDIKELVKRLRAFRPTYGWPEEQATVVKQTLGDEAADVLERVTEERDRLKAALEAKQTDPASAVCVWTRTPYTAMYSSTCCDENYLHKVTASGMCHRCDKPIKFTEGEQ